MASGYAQIGRFLVGIDVTRHTALGRCFAQAGRNQIGFAVFGNAIGNTDTRTVYERRGSSLIYDDLYKCVFKRTFGFGLVFDWFFFFKLRFRRCRSKCSRPGSKGCSLSCWWMRLSFISCKNFVIKHKFSFCGAKVMQTWIAFNATSHTRRWTWNIFKYFVAYEGGQSMDTDTGTIFRILCASYRIQ